MTEIAKKRIEEAIKERTESLNLSFCKLTEIPKELLDMPWLKTLSVSGNQIVKIENLNNQANLRELFLHENKICRIDNINKLVSLEKFSLYQNQILRIENLEGLGNLKELYLYDNQISKIENLENLLNLHKLSLHRNQISKIENLKSLVNLKETYLYGNQISKIENLENLVNLHKLSLHQNQISRIENLENLLNLNHLSLYENKISRIENLEGLVNLKELYLEQNQILKIENLESLINLYILSLEGNQISKIENLDELFGLKVVGLGSNPIHRIPNIDICQRIPVIDLTNTKIKSLKNITSQILNGKKVLWEEAKEDEFLDSEEYLNIKIGYSEKRFKKGVFVEDCHHLLYPAPEWIQLGPSMVKSYFQAIEEQGAEVMNEVKVLLVGDGSAGKTSLAQRLAKPEITDLPKAEARTRGVDIFDWSYRRKDADFLAHLWDFGGQVMYDMVHQYFYSQRALYIFVDSSRNGANEHDSRLNQLLQSAELFGRKSPMLMIQNEHSGHEKQMDFNLLQKNYPFLKEFKKVNLQTKEGLDEVADMIKRHIENIPSMGVVMPKKWLAIREKIKELAKTEATISLKEYRKICADCGVAEEKAQDILSKYFHQLGVFLHFSAKEGSALSKLIILNREWATKASYKVFDADFMKQDKQCGRFTRKDLKRFWEEPAFKDYHAELLDLMEEFEICYKLERSRTYLVPRMMDKMPDTDFCAADEAPLHFYYEYTFMPEGLLNRLSVRLHEDIGGERGDQVWSNGVVFEKGGRKAELREVRPPDSNSRIDIKIIGKDAHWLSQYLIMEIDKINADFDLERLKVEIKIPCICSICSGLEQGELPNFFKFRTVKADLLKTDTKFHSFPCEISREVVDYHQLLKTISHQAIKEVEEAKEQERRKHGGAFFGGEGRGKMRQTIVERERTVTIEPAGMTDEVADRVMSKIDSSTEQIITTFKSENQQLFFATEKLLKRELSLSEAKILKEIWENKATQNLNAEHAEQFFTIVSRSLDTLLEKVEDQDDALENKLLKAQKQLNNSTGIEVKDKIKLSVGILYGLVKLEKEVAVDNFRVFEILKETWEKVRVGDWKGIFVEEGA